MPGRASFTYDVFLSFRGEDTRLNFTGYLYSALSQRGIHSFFDDKEIRKGEEITPALFKAIKESRIAIVVLSEKYAFSSFCLKELTAILECYEEKKNNRVVFPVFYGVEPSDVRHGRGSYGEALAQHEKRFNDNKELVNKWRIALQKAAELAGFTFKPGDGYEYQFIQRIFKEVSLKINRTLLHVANYPVGLDSRVDKVISLLNVGSDDVTHVVGIHGIGGIGKSTIGRAVYNLISDHFEGFCCFVEDVRENSRKYGILHLQEMVLSEILGDKEIELRNVKRGMSIIEQRLCSKKVLLVLDDVDQKEQLEAIVGAPNWFGLGSRVIITTRDKGLLRHHVGEMFTYEVEELNDKEARELLTWNAFKTDKVDTRYTTILDRAVGYASRLPLALEVIGSNLFKRREEECNLTLDRYDRFPDKKINDILKVSFDSLEEDKRNIFLDIACCFGGYKLSDIENILHAHHDLSMRLSIEQLIEKSLIKIDDGLVTLHELIRYMGRDIVRQESQEPGKRSRLWFWEDVVQVLQENTGTSKIHILILDFPKDEVNLKGPEGDKVNWDGEAFKEMKNLKTLIISNGHFSKGPTHLPNTLRVLKWQGYPSPSLPSYFHPKKLSILELPDSYLKSCEPIQAFAHLRILDFSNSDSITEIPDVSGVPNLEKLSFRHCENLTKIDDSVGRLGNLKILDASGCKNLKTFPPIILTSLEELNVSHCSILESFPKILGKMEKITELHITWSPIKEYPFSIENLTRLQKLELHMCGMVRLPSSIISMLPELNLMHVSRCEGLDLSEQDNGKEMVSKSSNVDHLILSDCNISNDFLSEGLTFFSNVKDLDLSRNYFTTLHPWIKECRFLRNLKLDDCSRLQEIKGIPGKLEKISVKGCISLRCLDLTVLPECTAECCFLKELILDDCGRLREIAGLPPNLDNFSAKSCTSLTSQSISVLFNQEWIEAGNKMFVFPGRKIPEWFTHRTRGGSMSFWFRNKFPAISLCLVIRLADEQSTKFKFSPRVFINGNKQSLGCQRVYEFMISTDHILLLKFEDVDTVFSDNNWNHVEVSYVDHITNNEVSIRKVASYSGIHVFGQTSGLRDVQFNPPQTMINVNLDLNSTDGPQQRVKIVTETPQKDQTMVLSPPILTSTQPPPPPPPTDAEKGLAPQPILPIKRPLEDVGGETSESAREDEVYAITIQNDPPVIERCCDGDDVQFESASSSKLQSEESSSNTEGSDSDDLSGRVDKKLSASGQETLSPNSIDGPQQRVKIVTERPQKDQTMVLSPPILTLTQPQPPPPPTDAEKGLAPQPILPIKGLLEDVGGETSESVREDKVYAITIQNDPPVIERCREGDDVQFESASSSKLQSKVSSSNTEGSDSDDLFDRVVKNLSVSGLETISPGAKSEESSSNCKGSHAYDPINGDDRKISVSGRGSSSGDASLISIREAINALELLMVKDISQVSSDPASQSGLQQLLDLLSRRTAEVQEAIGEFKRKAFASFQEFQSTVESVDRLKNFEKHLDRIQQGAVTGKGQQKDLKNSIKIVSLAINSEKRRKKELDDEIATLKKQLATKERDLDQLVLNLKNQEATLSNLSTSCASLNEQAIKLLKEANDLLVTNSGIKDEGEAAEVKQNGLKSIWSTDLTLQLNKIKSNIFGLDD